MRGVIRERKNRLGVSLKLVFVKEGKILVAKPVILSFVLLIRISEIEKKKVEMDNNSKSTGVLLLGYGDKGYRMFWDNVLVGETVLRGLPV